MKLPVLKRKSISLGHSGIELGNNSDLDELQRGYSIDPEGNNLCSDRDGDWKSTWIVIGHETMCGDPIFVDCAESSLPVYTAAHGQGKWDPELISRSLKGFDLIIQRLEELAVNRKDPVSLEKNPISTEEETGFIIAVKKAGELEDAFFWELLLDDDA